MADGNVPAKPLRAPWLPREDATIRSFYPKAAVRAILAALPSRTWSAVRRRASALGVLRASPRVGWERIEVVKLRRLYPRASWDELLAALPRRTRDAIHEMARSLNLRREEYRVGRYAARVWTPAQDATLRAMWPEHCRRTICERLRRRWTAVAARAMVLGIAGTESSRWAGYVTVVAAAKLTGYSRAAFNRGLAAYQRHFRSLAAGGARDALPSPALTVRGRSGHRAHRLVDAQAAIDAIEWWDTQEKALDAARRIGVTYRALLIAVGLSGHRLRNAERHAPEWWDDIVAMHGPKRKVTR